METHSAEMEGRCGDIQKESNTFKTKWSSEMKNGWKDVHSSEGRRTCGGKRD